jgi:hypothetical protein
MSTAPCAIDFGADDTVWTPAPRNPCVRRSLVSACRALRSAFFDVLSAFFAIFSGLAELRALGPPTAGTAYDSKKTTARTTTVSVTKRCILSPSLG